jgi:hypothetical protein
MSSRTGTQYGSEPVIASVGVLRRGPEVIANGATFTSEELATEGQPSVNLWVQQTAGAAGVTVVVEFLNRPGEWEQFSTPILLAPLVPTMPPGWVLGQPRVRLVAQNTSGGNATIKFRLTSTTVAN